MPTQPRNVAIWFEIPVTDLDRAVEFYNTVLDQALVINTDMGPNPVAMFTYDEQDGTGGHLYPGKPSSDGPTVHLVAPDDLEATRARIFNAGGKIESDNIQLPKGAFFYARDLDGNSIGIFKGHGWAEDADQVIDGTSS